MIISQFPSGGSGGAIPQFTYTGEYTVSLDSGGWKAKFLSSGTLTMINSAVIDVFLVGGGGHGSNVNFRQNIHDSRGYLSRYIYGPGGGSGYTLTQKKLSLVAGNRYDIQVGGEGENSSISPQDSSEWGGNTYTAQKGASIARDSITSGGNGGSGGAGASYYEVYASGSYYGGTKSVSGGKDGANGVAGQNSGGGNGQSTTTREFGEPTGDLYASGGGAYYSEHPGTVIENSGNGGAGGVDGMGASGIVIIRNAR